MKLSRAAVGRVMAAAVDDAGGPVDERPVTSLHAVVHPPHAAAQVWERFALVLQATPTSQGTPRIIRSDETWFGFKEAKRAL